MNEIMKSKEYLLSRNLSLKAKGLLTFLLSSLEGEAFYKTELYNMLPDGKASINTAFKELVENGYIVVHQRRVEGKIDYDYDVYDTPINKEVK